MVFDDVKLPRSISDFGANRPAFKKREQTMVGGRQTG